MALGAQQSGVIRTVLGEVAILIGVGLAIGMAVTLAATHLVASLLHGIRANDPGMLSFAARHSRRSRGARWISARPQSIPARSDGGAS